MHISDTPSARELAMLLDEAVRSNLDASVIGKLRVMLHFVENHYSISDTCRFFGISRSTFHRWIERFDPRDLSSLQDRSHETHTQRQSLIPTETVELVRRYRMRYPHMGKERIAELLAGEHQIRLSPSSIGRVIERNCLYFADTPLHWKKRMQFKQEQQDDASVDAVRVVPMEATAETIDPAPIHVSVAAAPVETVEKVLPPLTERRPVLNWQAVKRFIVVSSLITNIVFALMIIGMSAWEHTVNVATQERDIQKSIDTGSTQLHAAPSTAPMP
jgi:transposase